MALSFNWSALWSRFACLDGLMACGPAFGMPAAVWASDRALFAGLSRLTRATFSGELFGLTCFEKFYLLIYSFILLLNLNTYSVAKNPSSIGDFSKCFPGCNAPNVYYTDIGSRRAPVPLIMLCVDKMKTVGLLSFLANIIKWEMNAYVLPFFRSSLSKMCLGKIQPPNVRNITESQLLYIILCRASVAYIY